MQQKLTNGFLLRTNNFFGNEIEQKIFAQFVFITRTYNCRTMHKIKYWLPGWIKKIVPENKEEMLQEKSETLFHFFRNYVKTHHKRGNNDMMDTDMQIHKAVQKQFEDGSEHYFQIQILPHISQIIVMIVIF